MRTKRVLEHALSLSRCTNVRCDSRRDRTAPSARLRLFRVRARRLPLPGARQTEDTNCPTITPAVYGITDLVWVEMQMQMVRTFYRLTLSRTL